MSSGDREGMEMTRDEREDASDCGLSRIRRGRGKLVVGSVLGASGLLTFGGSLCVGLWARSHSPRMGFGEMLVKLAENPDHRVLKEPFYSGLMVLVSVGGMVGLVALLLGVILVAVSVAARR